MTSPKLPTLRALAAELRELHAAWTHPDAGGEHVALCLVFLGTRSGAEGWELRVADVEDDRAQGYGSEYIPGDECPCARTVPDHTGPAVRLACTFDATAAARRLLAAARDAGFK